MVPVAAFFQLPVFGQSAFGCGVPIVIVSAFAFAEAGYGNWIARVIVVSTPDAARGARGLGSRL
jgi:hypothetical protein